MALRAYRLLGFVAAMGLAHIAPAGASAYLFWQHPDFSGAPVKGDEPGITLPLPGATPREVEANLIWNMRAGLNVAALQCQFQPLLMTVYNYNDMLKSHGKEINDAYQIVNGYFKRTGGPKWQTKFDQYTTRTYNSFSTLHGQLGFCDTAASIGREVIARPKGSLYLTAQNRMRELRNSLVPTRDGIFATRSYLAPRVLPRLAASCWDRKNRLNERKCPLGQAVASR